MDKALARTSCGVLVSDGTRILLGHATRSPRWDIPKGLAEPGERFIDAALRELREETGLVAAPGALLDLGVHPYLRQKDMALFAWRLDPLPDPASLRCSAQVMLPDGHQIPELDRFALLVWDEALPRLGKTLARLLAGLSTTPGWPFPMGRAGGEAASRAGRIMR
jgi:8-oxo-dGTP pyrophosphatase MutT (NUDIX family)